MRSDHSHPHELKFSCFLWCDQLFSHAWNFPFASRYWDFQHWPVQVCSDLFCARWPGGDGPLTHLPQGLTSVFLSLTSLSLVLGTNYRANSPHKAALVLCGQLKEKRRVDISKTWPLVSLALVPAFSLVCSMQIWDFVFHLEFCSGLNPSSGDDAAKFSLVLCQEQLWIEAGTEPGTWSTSYTVSYVEESQSHLVKMESDRGVIYSWCKIKVTSMDVFALPFTLGLTKEHLWNKLSMWRLWMFFFPLSISEVACWRMTLPFLSVWLKEKDARAVNEAQWLNARCLELPYPRSLGYRSPKAASDPFFENFEVFCWALCWRLSPESNI